MSGYAQLGIKVFLFLAPFGLPGLFFGRRDKSGIGPIKFTLNSLITLFLAPCGPQLTSLENVTSQASGQQNCSRMQDGFVSTTTWTSTTSLLYSFNTIR